MRFVWWFLVSVVVSTVLVVGYPSGYVVKRKFQRDVNYTELLEYAHTTNLQDLLIAGGSVSYVSSHYQQNAF